MVIPSPVYATHILSHSTLERNRCDDIQQRFKGAESSMNDVDRLSDMSVTGNSSRVTGGANDHPLSDAAQKTREMTTDRALEGSMNRNQAPPGKGSFRLIYKHISDFTRSFPSSPLKRRQRRCGPQGCRSVIYVSLTSAIH